MPSKASSASSPDAVLRGAIVALVLAAWCALWLWGRSPYGHLLLHGSVHMHLAVVKRRWFAGVFIGGWTLMTMAMMLPSSLPLILMFHRMVRNRATSSWLVSLLVAAYLGVWALCGVALLLLNWLLHAGVASVWWLATKPWLVGAIILTIAGLYQFSSLKYACLDKCRAPLSFVMSRWQGGNESVQAMRIGVEHGLFCVGCCWSLMLLMFLVSTGSLLWMLLLGVVMALEKNLSWGRRLSAPIGLLLLLGAAAVLIGGVRA